MKKLLNISFIYAITALLGGVFYREFTKFNGFTGTTTLSIVHLHLLVLGMIVFLLLLIFEKLFDITQNKKFKPFLIFYNIGLLLMVIMLLIKGVTQVLGGTSNAMLAGIAGIGHILLAVGIILLFVMLKQQISKKE
ncbi:MAG: DUF2871 domain-containing protein [Christensenellaceae bacterium]